MNWISGTELVYPRLGFPHRGERAEELSNSGGIVREQTKNVIPAKGAQARKTPLRSRLVGVRDWKVSTRTLLPDRSASAVNSRHFEPNRINDVVVKEWNGKKPDEPEVYLTNASVEKPLHVADIYDERSEIENRLHRELKQSHHLEHLLQKSEAGAYVHLYLLLSLYALVLAFRVWKREEEDRSVKGRSSSLQSFRKDIERENLGLVIVFDGEFYGIFNYVDLLAVMTQTKFRELSPVRTWEELCLKHPDAPPWPSRLRAASRLATAPPFPRHSPEARPTASRPPE